MEHEVGLPGMKIEIGAPVSTDGGLIFVIRHLTDAKWFLCLVASLHAAIQSYPNQNYGYAREEKLRRGLLALIAGMAMGYRSVNAIADVINADSLWRRTLGKRITQPDLSRLMELLGDVGTFALEARFSGKRRRRTHRAEYRWGFQPTGSARQAGRCGL